MAAPMLVYSNSRKKIESLPRDKLNTDLSMMKTFNYKNDSNIQLRERRKSKDQIESGVGLPRVHIVLKSNSRRKIDSKFIRKKSTASSVDKITPRVKFGATLSSD
jgi:hypothetical protein